MKNLRKTLSKALLVALTITALTPSVASAMTAQEVLAKVEQKKQDINTTFQVELIFTNSAIEFFQDGYPDIAKTWVKEAYLQGKGLRNPAVTESMMNAVNNGGYEDLRKVVHTLAGGEAVVDSKVLENKIKADKEAEEAYQELLPKLKEAQRVREAWKAKEEKVYVQVRYSIQQYQAKKYNLSKKSLLKAFRLSTEMGRPLLTEERHSHLTSGGMTGLTDTLNHLIDLMGININNN